MGTNYYLKTNCCPHCGRADDLLHIGKSSAGWVFGLRVHPDLGIRSLNDWKVKWREGVIENECGEVIPPDRMEEIITQRAWEKTWERAWEGYRSEAHFHELNYSMRGPNFLLRRQLVHGTVGHGEGTWDYIERDFS